MGVLKISAVKTRQGYYISDKPQGNEWGQHQTDMRDFAFDGRFPLETWHSGWVLVSSVPNKIERKQTRPNINYRYELVDHDLPEDKFPRVLLRDNVAYKEDYDWFWKAEYSHMKSLYKLVSDAQEPVMVDVPFIFVVVLEIDGLVDFSGVRIPGFSSGRPRVESQILDSILFPDIVLPSRPCRLTSRQSYDLVRAHVQANIDPRWAAITSDYDFCFTVKKMVRLGTPITQRTEIKNARGKSYKNRRYRTKYIKDRSVTVFEMTHSPKPYRGYTPIAGFRGDNWQDLEHVIEKYLIDLMEIINAPLTDCSRCGGMGVIELAEIDAE